METVSIACILPLFQTKEILSKHLMLYLRKDSKVKANNVAKEYVNCQVGII